MFGIRNVKNRKKQDVNEQAPHPAPKKMDVEELKKIKLKIRSDLGEVKEILESQKEEQEEDLLMKINKRVAEIETGLNDYDCNFELLFEKLETLTKAVNALMEVVFPEKQQKQ